MFDSNRKKTFHSQALNRLTVLERLTWLIPVGFIVCEIIYTHSEIEEVLQDSFNYCYTFCYRFAGRILVSACKGAFSFCKKTDYAK